MDRVVFLGVDRAALVHGGSPMTLNIAAHDAVAYGQLKSVAGVLHFIAALEALGVDMRRRGPSLSPRCC